MDVHKQLQADDDCLDHTGKCAGTGPIARRVLQTPALRCEKNEKNEGGNAVFSRNNYSTRTSEFKSTMREGIQR